MQPQVWNIGTPRLSVWIGLWIVPVCFLGSGCRTTVGPPTHPVANLYPTVYSSAVLADTRGGVLTISSLTSLLKDVGLLDPLRQAGLRQIDVQTMVRGLAHRGYAEIDARRCNIDIRWVVVRLLPVRQKPEARLLVLEAGGREFSQAARHFGIDVTRPPVESTRRDVYGRRFALQTWSVLHDGDQASLRRVSTTDGTFLYWELEVRMPGLAVAAPAAHS